MTNSLKIRSSKSDDNALRKSSSTPFEKLLEKEPFYHGLLPREDSTDVLKDVGDFLVRISEPREGEPRSYILTVMSPQTGDDKFKHYVIKHSFNKFMIDKYSFDSIQQLLSHHVNSQEPIREDVKLRKGIPRQVWELEHENIVILKKLGEGAFGEVCLGTLKPRRGGKLVQVAIKTAKLDKMTKEQIKEFMAEARVMRQFNHPNVVRFYGVAVVAEPLYLVMELASNGALDSYLQKNPNLTVIKKNEMILQAAWGIEYLHSRPVLHRDIAARNCLYGEGKVKISDFGLTRPGILYQMDAGKKVPIKWLSVETLKQHIYTPFSDVWSYGIMCWEIFHNGKEPYPGMRVPEVLTMVQNGQRMTFDPAVNPAIQNMIITKCWAANPCERYTSSEICIFLERMTQVTRPDFQAIAKQHTAELANMNQITMKTNKRKAKKVTLPRGMVAS